MNPVPSVFSYTDYRTFLEAHYQDVRERNPRWSYNAWANRLGLKNNTSILKVMKGQREAGPEITSKLIQYFRFGAKEKEYFEDLVRLSKIQKDPRLRVLLMEKLEKTHPDGKFRLLDSATFAAISLWWCYAIREMIRLKDFRRDPEWISKRLRFGVSIRDVQKALDNLIKAGLIRVDPATKKLRVAEGRINTSDDVASEAIRRFHEQMLSHAREAVRSVQVEMREISGCTLNIKKENIPAAKEMIRKFQNEFCRTFEESPGDETYQLQVQFFPLTQEVTP